MRGQRYNVDGRGGPRIKTKTKADRLTSRPAISRRATLISIASAGIVSLAGCLGNDDEEGTEPAITVVTGEATDVGSTAATLGGEITALDGLEEADVYFEFGPADGELDSRHDVGTVDTPQSFEGRIENLPVDTEYAFRAVAKVEGLEENGDIVSFTTQVPEPDHTVTVSGTSFTPGELMIAVGETIEWVFEGGTHNVFVTESPEASNWEGTEGFDTFGQGHVHQHTFTVPGTYEYYCQPHSHLGMEGTIVVED